MHLLVPTPFHKQPQDETISLLHIKSQSERFDNSQINLKQDSQFVSDIPLPRCLSRHVDILSPTLSTASPNKISGFMIQVKGRRGTRSSKQVLLHGKLNLGERDSEFADFARSYYVHKKGVTGVKVWVGYNR